MTSLMVIIFVDIYYYSSAQDCVVHIDKILAHWWGGQFPNATVLPGLNPPPSPILMFWMCPQKDSTAQCLPLHSSAHHKALTDIFVIRVIRVHTTHIVVPRLRTSHARLWKQICTSRPKQNERHIRSKCHLAFGCDQLRHRAILVRRLIESASHKVWEGTLPWKWIQKPSPVLSELIQFIL